MNQVGKISVRPLNELISEDETIGEKVVVPDIIDVPETPKKINKRKKAATTSKKIHNVVASTPATITPKTEVKKPRSSRKNPLPGQLRIDSFYNSAIKNYKIEAKPLQQSEASIKGRKVRVTPRKSKRCRKALLKDDDSSTTVSDDKNFVLSSRKTKIRAECVIDLCSDNETDDRVTAVEALHLRLTNESPNSWQNNESSGNGRVPVEDFCEALLQITEEVITFQENVSNSPESPTNSVQPTTALPSRGQNNESRGNGSVPVDDFCDVSLQTTEEVIIFQENVSSSPKTPTNSVQLKTTSPPTSQNFITPKKPEYSPSKQRNCNVWLRKSIERSTETTSTTPTETSTSCNNLQSNACELGSSAENWKKSTKALTRSQAKKSASGQEMKSKSSQKLIPTPATSTESTRSKKPKKDIIRKPKVLSPSDSNTSRAIKRSPTLSTDESLSKKQKSTILPTTPESMEQASKAAELKTENNDLLKLEQSSLQEYSLSADIIAISDEEQENIKIQKLTSTKKRKKCIVKNVKTESKKTPRPCPPYKVVEGTSFAVDGFRYGDIAGVTHYFLTHFHADHYVGLSRKFAHPLYMSSITARLLRVFIPIEEQYIRELSLNTPVEIADVEVTAIDANHCPGAIMLIFKTREGRCILHTGDFRASAQMESEPIFWNNDIHTIYLDTTYFPNKYAFCAQSDSIDRGLYLLEEFNEKNVGTRILYVCGSYLIGKEKFWSKIAQKLSLKVWTDVNRRKALNAIQDEELLSLLVDDPYKAHLHVIPMVHLSYFTLVDYLDKYAEHFDVLFALRPSGWEKNSKPQFRGKVNIVGIEYSEHSSHDEMKRFVQYLKPQKVISTVPVSHDIMKTAKIPDNWYKYETLTGLKKYQPAITSYFKPKNVQMLTDETLAENPTIESSGGNRMIVSPLEQSNGTVQAETKADEKVEEKININNAEEDDDWLT